jgi:hypothetical protein
MQTGCEQIFRVVDSSPIGMRGAKCPSFEIMTINRSRLDDPVGSRPAKFRGPYSIASYCRILQVQEEPHAEQSLPSRFRFHSKSIVSQDVEYCGSIGC